MQVRFGNYGIIESLGEIKEYLLPYNLLSLADFPKAVSEKFHIPLSFTLLLDGTSAIKTASDTFSPEDCLYAIHTDLKEPESINKYYEESSYSKPVSIGNMTIPVQILGQEIKEPFNFIGGSDVPSLAVLKEIDKAYYEDYRWQVDSYKEFKAKAQKCFEVLKECEVQYKTSELLSKTIQVTLENGNEFRREFSRKIKEAHEHNCKILHSFEESLEKLKRTELHPCLKTGKHKTLMDVYYSESHMRNWSDACKRGEEQLFEKVDKLEQSLNAFQQQLATANFPPTTQPVTALTESKELISHLENFLNEKEPLIISMLSTLADDLRNFHSVLKVEIIEKIPEDRVQGFKAKIKAHKELIELMKEHQKELDGLLKAFIKTKLSNAKSIGLLLKEVDPLITQLNAIINDEVKKSLNESVAKIKADFGFLLNPGLFPGAYTESLKEIIRRTNINSLLIREAKRLAAITEREQAQRQAFVDSYGKILPGNFFAYLKNVQPPVSIKIEPVKEMQEINDAELEKSVDISKIKNEFEGHRESELEKELDKLRSENEKYKSEHKVNKDALRKELEELQKDFDQQKAENISIQSSLHSKISELDFALQMKTSDEAKLQKTMKVKEERISDMEKEQEKLHKMIQEMTVGFKEQLARKQLELDKKEKELHNLLLDLQNNTLRKKNCAFCGELIEFKGNKDDYLAEINQKLLEKNTEIKLLEGKLEQTTKMMSAAGSSLFNLMTNKVNDKELKLRMTKENYEKRLMEAEEYLASEHDKCTLFTKQQLASLNEKLVEVTKQKEKELSDLQAQRDKDIAALTTKAQRLESKANYYEKDYVALSVNHQKLVTSEKALRSELEHLKREARIRKEVVLQKDSIIKQLTEQKQALVKDCTEAKLAVEGKVTEIERLNAQKEELERSLLGLEAKLSEKCKELAAAEAKVVGKQKEKEALVESDTERIKALEAKLQTKEAEIERLRSVEAQLKTKEAECERLFVVESKLSLKEEETNNYRKEVGKLKESIQAKEQEIDTLKNEVVTLENRLITIQDEIKEKQTIIEKLKAEPKPTPGENNEDILRAKLKENETELSRTQMQLREVSELVRSLKAREDESKRELEAMRNLANTEAEEITCLKASLQRVRDEVSSKEKMLESNARTLLETRTKLESFERQIVEHQRLKETWEETLRNASSVKKTSIEGINYSIFEKGCKMLFMPHSPGIYVALLLTELSGEEEKKQATAKKQGINVVKKKMNSYVFLDLQSLPEKLQTILMNFSMLVIGVVKDVAQCNAVEENPYKLDKGQKYYQCTLQRLENIVGFEADEPLLTNYEFIQQDS